MILTTVLGLFLSVFTITLVPNLASAHPNPQYRACTQHGANFVVVDVGFDQIGVCQIDTSFVGAIDMIRYFWESSEPQALTSYFSGFSGVCPVRLQGVSLEGASFELCQFSDGSVIDENSLLFGSGHPAQIKLDQFLKNQP